MSERPAAPARPGRLTFAAVLTIAMAVGTLPQFLLGAFAPMLVEDLRVSRTELGALTSAFFTTSAITSPLIGRIGGRLGGRWLLLALFATAAATLAAMAVAPSYGWMLAAVAVGGLACAAGNPATNDLVAVHLPEGRRGTVIGVKQSGVQAGSFISGAALLPLALEAGWRATLLVLAVFAALSMIAAARVVPPAGPGADDEQPQVSAPVGWLLVYAFFMGAGVAALSTYIVLYATETLGVSEAWAGSLLAIQGGVAVVARIVWSRAAERFTTTAAPLAVIAAGSIVAIAVLALAGPRSSWLAFAAAAGIGVTGAAWNAVGMLAIVRESARSSTSQASGSVLTGFFVGLLVMPLAFGGTVDATGSYRLGWALTAATFAGALVVTLLWLRSDARTSPARAS